MIFQILYFIIVGILSVIGSFFPGYGEIPLLLPWGLDNILIVGFAYLNAFIDIFPPIGIVLEAFIIYLGFRLGMIFLKLFIGHRAPVTN